MICLSVIIPVYNVESYIASCLDTILAYPGGDMEVVAVVDGSKDNSEAILREYAKKDGRLRIEVQQNQGVSTARNRGMELARGKYLTFVDADDWIDTKSLELLMECLNKKQEDIELFLTDYIETSEKKEQKKELRLPQFPAKETIFELAVSGSKMNFCWGKVYVTEIINTHQLRFRKDVKIGEDVIFVMDYLEHVKNVEYLSCYFYYYRQNQESVMRTVNTKRFYEMKYSYERRMEFITAHNLQASEQSMHEYYRKAVYIYLKQIQEMPKSLKEKCKVIHEVIKIPLIRQILLGEMLPCRTKWQKKVKLATKTNTATAIWYVLRKITMQDILTN